MFQVVVSYLESRFACFTEKPFSVYEELLQTIKEVVPYIRNIPFERIRVAYKDINLSTNRESDEGFFINISIFHIYYQLNEAFRNAYDCGSESFKRLHIKKKGKLIRRLLRKSTTTRTRMSAEQRQAKNSLNQDHVLSSKVARNLDFKPFRPNLL